MNRHFLGTCVMLAVLLTVATADRRRKKENDHKEDIPQPEDKPNETHHVEDQPEVLNEDEKPHHTEDEPLDGDDKPHRPEIKPTRPQVKPHRPENKPHLPEDKPHRPEDKPHHPEDKPHHPEDKPHRPEDEPHHPGDGHKNCDKDKDQEVSEDRPPNRRWKHHYVSKHRRPIDLHIRVPFFSLFLKRDHTGPAKLGVKVLPGSHVQVHHDHDDHDHDHDYHDYHGSLVDIHHRWWKK